jgi:nicotinate dehydrogenase subunit B
VSERPLPQDVEVERYELAWPRAYRFLPGRRGFVQILGGVVVLVLAPAGQAQESGRAKGDAPAAPPDQESRLSTWLHLDVDGTVTVYTGKVEVGQNARTSLTQSVADELHVPPATVHLVMGDTDLTPYDLGTFGSRTTPFMVPQLRRAAKAAREAIVEMAAKAWSVPASEVVLAGGEVRHEASGRSQPIGTVTKGQTLVRTIDRDMATTPADHWTVAGTPAAKVDGRDFVTGRHRFPSDIVPGAEATSRPAKTMAPSPWHGKVLRPPSVGAVLVSVDTSGAEAVKGAVVVHDGDFVGVAASRAAVAERALGALRAEWRPTDQPRGDELFDLLRRSPERGEARGPSPEVVGSVTAGLTSAYRRFESTYTVAYIAHVPLEPRAAVALWQNKTLTVWTGTQRPFGVRSELAEAFHMPDDAVRVRVPDTGSAYGGKHTGECAIEAARLAKAAGRAVKVVWTREEEFRWAYFRPAGVIDVRSGTDAEGRFVAWEMHNYNSGASGLRSPYESPNLHLQFHPSPAPLRQGSYRGLAATANHFARESHLDEIAAGLRIDPLELRKRNLKDARLAAVLDAAAERFGWRPGRSDAGHGYGIACGVEKGGYVAACAEVLVKPGGEVRVLRLVTAFECGAIVNPDQLTNQVEGAVLMGLGGALFEEVRFDQGRILNPRLSAYRVPRFSDVPQLEVVLLERKDLASAGAGETPIVGPAPAVANAIFAATGVRLRALPLVPRGLPRAPA